MDDAEAAPRRRDAWGSEAVCSQLPEEVAERSEFLTQTLPIFVGPSNSQALRPKMSNGGFAASTRIPRSVWVGWHHEFSTTAFRGKRFEEAAGRPSVSCWSQLWAQNHMLVSALVALGGQCRVFTAVFKRLPSEVSLHESKSDQLASHISCSTRPATKPYPLLSSSTSPILNLARTLSSRSASLHPGFART